MMKTCPRCQAQMDDNARFCTVCGASFAQPDAQPAPQPQYAPPAPDPADHTAEFDAQDISENKVFAMLPYAMSVIGVIIALLAPEKSAYVRFHVRQALKVLVLEFLLLMAGVVLYYPVSLLGSAGAPLVVYWLFNIFPFAAFAGCVFLAVLRVISFIQVCRGKAKEPVIISKIGFLK